MRTDIINSINEKIESYGEEIEKYDISIVKEQEKLRLLMSDEEITLEALIELKEQIFSASDAEIRILEIEQEIKTLQSKLSISETSSEETKNKREDVINVILSEMNALYKAIDPNGNLVFE
jgi:superfamily I DNA and RNA helicase